AQFQKAMEYYKKSLDIFEKENQPEFIATLLMNIGIIYARCANYEKSIKSYLKSMDKINELSPTPVQLKTDILNNIGNAYLKMGDTDKSMTHYSESLQLVEKHNYEYGEANVLNSIGNIYYLKKDWNKALSFHNKSLNISEKIDYKQCMVINLQTLSKNPLIKKEFKNSIKYSNRALKIAIELNDLYSIIISYENLANLYFEIKEYDNVLIYLNKAIISAEKEKMLLECKDIYLLYSDTYKKKNNYEKALEYFKKYFDIDKKIFNDETQKKITEMQTKYETERKEKEAEIYHRKSDELEKMNAIIETQKKELEEFNKTLASQVEAEVKKRQKQQQILIQKSKLESLGRLSAGIAHEMNQPLGGISMGMDMLLHKVENNTFTKKYLKTKINEVFEDIKQIETIIQNIRTFSRDQKDLVLDRIDVNKVIRRSLSFVQTQYHNHNVSLEIELKDNLSFTIGNPNKLQQVVLNLLSNAKDAVDEQSRIVGDLIFKKKIQIKTYAENEKIYIEVFDNGCGITENDMENIFEPFYTTKNEEKGTGLGLSISYGIVKEMKGEIQVESKENEYTRMKVSLPGY
ncbi:MAG: tetratricopeptide repeat-containing sensor histidine kinase, partial [Candidatus Cloacimonetes bacterium]|nr:tetratricopeptide repeat-containing sensor histidine kinase [Candidatus Cloacimonadota bacterium]